MIFSGTIGYNAKLAVEELAGKGIACTLFSMPSVKPIDEDAILDAAKTGAVITVEEHNLHGGLGSAVAEVLMDRGAGNIRFRRIALPDVNVCKVGSQEWLRAQYGMSPEAIAATIEETLN